MFNNKRLFIYPIMPKRTTVGFIEPIQLMDHEIPAKIDTGADVSSIDIGLAAKLQLGPIVQRSRIKSAHGRTRRPVISVDFIMAGKKVTGLFNLSDRHRLKYKILIGKNILKEDFIIDPLKT